MNALLKYVVLGGMLMSLFSAHSIATDYDRPSSSASANVLGPEFSDHYVSVGDVRLHYVSGGNGPPVLLVPGWPETWWAWREVMPTLAKRFTVFAVDTRGMGQSSRPAAGYDMKSVADDLYRMMMQLG